MARHGVPPHVLTFLSEHVGSLHQFQLLLQLVQSGDRWWDAASAAREVGITPEEARAALDHLARHNLLDISIRGDVRYQFRPGTEPLREAAHACVAEFRRTPIEILELVAGTPRRRIRAFADAFRIRRDDDR